MKSSVLFNQIVSLSGDMSVTQWFHTRSATIYEKFGKFFIAVLIYFLICFCLKKIFAKLQDNLEKKTRDKRTVALIIKPIEYSLDTFFLCLIIVQWVFTEHTKIASKIRIMTYDDVYRWLHYKSPSIMDYILKVIIAFLVFIVVSEIINGISRFILTRVNDINFSGSVAHVLMKVVKYSIQAFLVVISVIQLFIVEYNMIAAVIVAVVVLIVAAYKLRNVNFKSLFDKAGINDLDAASEKDVTRAASLMNSVVSRVAGVVILLLIFFFISRGFNSVSNNTGKEISQLVAYPEAMIAKELDTEFKEVSLATAKVPGLKGNSVSVHSDGSVNIIYVNDEQVGVNTDSADYLFFGVGVGQSEIKALDSMRYAYEKTEQSVVDLTSGQANTFYYFNEKDNDCLALTVNKTSNRVVSITYYTDYETIAEILDIDHD
ncbi:MAG: hypothetical protein K6E27_05410 [Eubacterium sp.]|nr:hypothetical protein [Eubacterium sp.]